ncbi:hypothetical protein GCM10012285_54670 [Streptomyces kronopolitis]|uniref:Uncharacterized protein n=1 Tax=Streptomyces kronopolitis TaxID=1612435 RepID=A0ABQ2JV77_9ACTN|nr:hypothetical protein GCM10012285_54670 [Streptomyces kronopolitis]
MPVAFETNRERSGASSAQSGSPIRGARKRFSQSGIASAAPPEAAAGPAAPAMGPAESVGPDPWWVGGVEGVGSVA